MDRRVTHHAVIARVNRTVADVTDIAKRVINNVEQVIVGKRQQLILSMVSWFSEGHILLEDVPGVAKTILARALARSVGCEFKRIQCTPDLLPTDVTGASVFHPKTTAFEFRHNGWFHLQLPFLGRGIDTTPRTGLGGSDRLGRGGKGYGG